MIRLWRHGCALAFVGAALLPACSTTANVSDVVMALDGDGDRVRNVFFTDTKEIYCVASMAVGRRGVTVEAMVRQLSAYDFDRREFVERDAVAAVAEASPAPSPQSFTFHVRLTPLGPDGKPNDDIPFAPGRYQCEVRLDGELKGISLFNIEFPECPTATIIPQTLCYGFYEEGKGCPFFGVSSRDPASCTCRLTGWECGP
jgi:hypothetical protein